MKRMWVALLVTGCGISQVEIVNQPTPVKPAVRPAKILRVTVLDPNGLPMEKVEIHPSVWTEEKFEEKDVFTDREGRAEVALPATFEILRVWATKSPYVPMFFHWEGEELQKGTDAVPPEFTVRMTRGTTIGGFVHNEEGKPVAGARVEVMRDGAEDENDVRMSYDIWLAYGTAAAFTDERGYWSIDNAPPETFHTVSLKLSHGDYIRDLTWGGLQKEQGVGMDALRARTARITLRRGIVVTGSVLDDLGRGIPNALVVWGDDPYFEEGNQEVLTDKNGHFQLQPLPPGPRNLTVMARDWAPDLRKIEIEKTMHPVDFRMRKGKTIRIRCVDGAGRPVPEAYVSLDGWRGLKSLYNHQHPNVVDSWIPWRTGKNGVFEWTWAPEDEVKYRFAIKRYDTVAEATLAPRDEVHEVRLVREE